MASRTIRILGAVSALAAAAAVTGCGSSEELAPAAEPPDAPPARASLPGRVVRVGDEPEGLVADPRTGILAVGQRRPDRLLLLDGATGRKLRRLRLPESPRHLALAPGSRVLVPAERSDELAEVRLPGGSSRSIEVGTFPHDAAAAGGRVFVADEFGNAVSVVQGDRVVRTLGAPTQPGGIAANGRTVVLVAVAQRVVATYDARTLAAGGIVSGGEGPTHVVTDCDRGAYVADTQGDAVLAYELRPELRRVGRIGLGSGPYGIDVDCRRKLLWVTLPGRNRLVALRLGPTGKPARRVASFPTPRQPNSVAADPLSGRVFVAGRDGGAIQILPAGAVAR